MFDRYSAAVAPRWGRRALVLASIALHAGAFVSLIVYSWMHIEEVTAPALVLRFFAVPQASPPPLGSHAKRQHSAKPKLAVPNPTAIHAPTAPVEPERADPPDDTPPEGPPGDGDPRGVPGGDPHGVPGNPPGGAPGVQPSHETMVAGFTLTASRVSYALPHLPEWFTAQHPRETVHGTFMVCLDTSGHVSRVSTVRSIAGNVDDTIVDQIKSTWLYKPQRLPVCFAQPFAFKID
jgi:hypothetical protein